MKSNLLMNFSIDKDNRKVKVEREFDAPLAKVWSAWTDSKMLDQWWAPKPWKAKTKTQEFKEGGKWLYAMVGPEGQEHWSFLEYISISPKKTFSAKDGFCDKDGNIDTTMPQSKWKSNFSESDGVTLVTIDIEHEKLSDLEKLIEMGFKEGFTMALENLDELLKK